MAYVITVYCHGAKDQMSLPDYETSETDPRALEQALARGGTAFQNKVLENDHTRAR